MFSRSPAQAELWKPKKECVLRPKPKKDNVNATCLIQNPKKTMRNQKNPIHFNKNQIKCCKVPKKPNKPNVFEVSRAWPGLKT